MTSLLVCVPGLWVGVFLRLFQIIKLSSLREVGDKLACTVSQSLTLISRSINSSKGLPGLYLTIYQLLSVQVLMLESLKSQVGFLKE